MRLLAAILGAAALLGTSFVHAEDIPATFTDVSRIVAVGDVHGDYDQLRRVLLDAGVINERNKWIAGDTHLVQVGDVPDRGPDTLDAIRLLQRLQKQSRRKGGRVHALIGNHEALNIIGDLRYVHPGEYEAFSDRNSRRLQDAYLDASISHIRNTLPEPEWPEFNAQFELDFRSRHPLGYVEHRRAWAPGGDVGKWVLRNNAVIKINDILFVHGGLSGKYAHLSLAQINDQVRSELSAPDRLGADAMVDDQEGPLWYRGLTIHDDRLEAEQQRVTDMLAARGASRIVVAHTPVTGAILPRFDARVIGVDVGLSAHYGARVAALVIEGDEAYALHRGTRLDLPTSGEELVDYLEKASALDPAPSPISRYIRRLAERAPLATQEPAPQLEETSATD